MVWFEKLSCLLVISMFDFFFLLFIRSTITNCPYTVALWILKHWSFKKFCFINGWLTYYRRYIYIYKYSEFNNNSNRWDHQKFCISKKTSYHTQTIVKITIHYLPRNLKFCIFLLITFHFLRGFNFYHTFSAF